MFLCPPFSEPPRKGLENWCCATIVEFFDDFLTFFALHEKCRKVSENIFDTFLDGGNSTLVVGFQSRPKFWDLKSTNFKGISEPLKLS